MKSYNNLPSQQHPVQRLADQFNADERLRRSLEGKRKRRRNLHSGLSSELHRQLDLLDFAMARPPQDGIGEPVADCDRSSKLPKHRRIGFYARERGVRYGH